MLPQVLGPRRDLKSLDIAARLGRIAKHIPAESTIAQPNQSYLLQCLDEVVVLALTDSVFNLHEHRPFLEGRLNHRLWQGQMLRRAKVKILTRPNMPAQGCTHAHRKRQRSIDQSLRIAHPAG